MTPLRYHQIGVHHARRGESPRRRQIVNGITGNHDVDIVIRASRDDVGHISVFDNGTSFVKRIGSRLPSSLAHLRLFETIGSLGSSIVIATEAMEGHGGIPLMIAARHVLGVLYGEI